MIDQRKSTAPDSTGSRRERYADRAEAGDALARQLGDYADRDDVVVLGLPRGGVPVAARVAAALHAPLDVLIVRKLGLPGHPELAMGAIAGVGDATDGGALEIVRNDVVLEQGRPSQEDFDDTCQREAEELQRREAAYRHGRAALAVRGRVAIVVDDGLATGSTMRAAVAALRRQRPVRVVVAVPIAPPRTCAELAAEVDEIVCPWTPESFSAVGQGYRHFRPTEDDEVRRLIS